MTLSVHGRTRPRLQHKLVLSAGTARVQTFSDLQPENGPTALDEHLLSTPVDSIPGQTAIHEHSSRSYITEWSAKSKIRMMYRLATLDWENVTGVLEMVTLTYPREFPGDGRDCKRHLQLFRKRYERKFGPIQGVWKMEFQRRGAPHFHLYIGRPVMPWKEFLLWARNAWFEIVGSGDLRHLDQGVRVDRQFCSKSRSVKAVAWYFTKHQLHSGNKSYQNKVPKQFQNVGRFWGVWGMEANEVEIELTPEQFVQIRRDLVKLRRAALKRSSARKPKAAGRLIGLWALSCDGFGLGARLLTLYGGEPFDPPPVRPLPADLPNAVQAVEFA